jgi:cytochrome c oxidase subunit II
MFKRLFAFLSAVLGLALVTPALAAIPVPWGINFQPAASPIMAEIQQFHQMLLWIIIGIVVFVLALLLVIAARFNEKRNPVPSKTSHNTLLEVVWTAVPVLILVVIAIPSFRLLYRADKAPDAEMALKVTGHQWYWSYEYPDHGDIGFDAYMIQEADLKPEDKALRLLKVDKEVVLPVDTRIQILVTGADVIHSWAIPAFGVKKDAIPGRINETWVQIDTPGTYYGQCSEICGTGHAFMPIAVRAVSKQDFAAWVKQQGGKMPGKPLADSSLDTSNDQITSPAALAVATSPAPAQK